MPKADIVIGCLPDTPLTRGILTYERLNSMKQGTVLVNVGRGSLVRNEDMIRVLRQGRLKGVIMDVSETEPLPAESPLWDMKNVIITPHIAGPSFGGNAGVQNMIWKDLHGKPGTLCTWKISGKYRTNRKGILIFFKKHESYNYSHTD